MLLQGRGAPASVPVAAADSPERPLEPGSAHAWISCGLTPHMLHRPGSRRASPCPAAVTSFAPCRNSCSGNASAGSRPRGLCLRAGRSNRKFASSVLRRSREPRRLRRLPSRLVDASAHQDRRPFGTLPARRTERTAAHSMVPLLRDSPHWCPECRTRYAVSDGRSCRPNRPTKIMKPQASA